MSRTTAAQSAPVSSTHRRAHRTIARAGATAALAAGLVIAAPLAASAHVGVSPETVDAGTSSVLTFAFSHGCDGSPTTALAFDIPEGITNVTPTVQAGWSIDVTRADNDSVSQVVYTADEPVEDGLRATVAISVRVGADLANSSVGFPVTQRCETGEIAWTQIPEEGQGHDDLDSPAPLVAVGAEASDDHHGGGSTDGDAGSDAGHSTEDGHADGDSHADAGEASNVSTGSDVLPVVLGGGGLLAGVAALVVAVFALRRRA